ncbi:MAG: type II toxin-antitoxin system Phd/YefM family antitoxin [Evtepia sp.]
MINTNVTHFRKNVSTLLEQTLKFNEPIHVSTKNGNVVVLSEDDYRGILETLEMNANPVMKQKLLEGKDTPLSECIPETNAADL